MPGLQRGYRWTAIRHAQRRPEDDPSNTQTADTISAHYRNAKVGDIAVIRETLWRLSQFSAD